MILKREQGYSLVELVIFIVIIGIVSLSLMIGLNTAVLYSGQPRGIAQASYLANARMQIILMSRAINGYSSLSDPCTTTPSLAICTPLTTYASTNGFTVSTPSISGADPKVITVRVSGAYSATVSASVYNYANN
jgi:type II secretory pathway pseudopilin PulG